MPLVRIEIIKGHLPTYKKELMQAVHDALVSSLGIEDDDRFQRLYELDADCFERRSAKTDRFTLIELTLLPGRSKELKKTVIEQVTRLLTERLDIAPTDILIIMLEPPLENWGLYGKQAIDLDLKYQR